jgi:RimJ/RimL family protein N-acetyltransferase
MIDPNDIQLRNFSEEDIPLLIDYWLRSPEGFIESLGVDLGKLKPEEEMRAVQLERCKKWAESPEECNVLAILYKGQTIGVHGISDPKSGENGVFHAHIWLPEFRRRGIGSISYVKAMKFFADRFQLKEILFKTPEHNPGPNGLKEKLGLNPIGKDSTVHEEIGIMKPGLTCLLYSIEVKQVEELYSNLLSDKNSK